MVRAKLLRRMNICESKTENCICEDEFVHAVPALATVEVI